MTSRPRTLTIGARVGEALELFERHKISELPVIDADGRPVGLLDITDVIGIATVDELTSHDRQSA